MKQNNLSRAVILFAAVCLIVLMSGMSHVYAQDYTVNLTILNTPVPTGEVAVVSGTDIEVEFVIIDPNNELVKEDLIRLVRVDNGLVLSEKMRGLNMSGSVSLKTASENADGQVKVQYVHNNVVIKVAPVDRRLLILADNSELELLARINALEETDPVPGPQGPIGPQGPQGIQGPAGVTGPQGLKGDQGIAGVAGPQGLKGDQGIAGAAGPQGLKGDQGIAGVAGPQGLKGDKGDTGDTGPQGLKGDQGIAGVAGPQGLKGDKGDTGDTGPQGLKGDQGIAGVAGPQGLKGDKGDTGDTGPQGLKGDQGIAGVAGPQGQSGLLALAGMSCPANYFVTGFDANGGLICTYFVGGSAAVCGNGAISGTETCDDGNATSGDGCSSLCKIESGWTCSGQTSSCVRVVTNICGNGIISGAETCDDGNITSADGCSSLCQIESNWTCSGQPSACTALGGPGSGPIVCTGVSADCGSYLGPWADLYECNLTDENLFIMDMNNACMHGAILINANLNGASFYRVDLSNADFTGANMLNTDFTDANLTNANLSGATSVNTIIWWNTTCPDGTNSHEHGNTCIGHLL